MLKILRDLKKTQFREKKMFKCVFLLIQKQDQFQGLFWCNEFQKTSLVKNCFIACAGCVGVELLKLSKNDKTVLAANFYKVT
jgi:hypothetical protein